MKADPPEGWAEVYHGSCLDADVIQAVLEANGLKPVRDQRSPQAWWSGPVMEDCRVYVPADELEAARQALVEHEPEG